MNIPDSELLQRYTRDGSEPAFEELVRRHVNLIHSAALRQVNGDATLAEDVTQAVFTDLARKAGQLTRHTSLTGWLYTSTRFIAANIRRTEQRRAAREQEAHSMNAFFSSLSSEPNWAQIRPLLDDAMHTLDEPDREAVLLRHFECRSFAEIGEQLGIAENTARMRVTRALEKLEEILRKRGVTSTALALAGILTANGVGVAPAHLAGQIARTALTGATAGGLSALAGFWSGAKAKMAAAALLGVGLISFLVATSHQNVRPKTQTTVAADNANVTVTNDVSAKIPAITSADMPVLRALKSFERVLHLKIVAADSGLPIPHVPVQYEPWRDESQNHNHPVSSRQGMLDVIYPTNMPYIKLVTQVEGFADTALTWSPPLGDVIPTNYTLRLGRSVPIGGLVVDGEGNPVSGATVHWYPDDSPGERTLPENHEFGMLETKTDEHGRWRVNRIAADMMPRIHGYAGDPNVLLSAPADAGDKTVEALLRSGAYVFHFAKMATIRGIVVDTSGTPVAGAEVFATMIKERIEHTRNDGAFALEGCPAGKTIVTAQAIGYGASTTNALVSSDASPVRIILSPAHRVRLRVVNSAGQAIPNARVYYECMDADTILGESARPTPQDSFMPTTDANGCATWSNAPSGPLSFDAEATGYLRCDAQTFQADGGEHTIMLIRATTVHGTAVDEATGQPLSRFRVGIGWAAADGKVQPARHWSNDAKYWGEFGHGQYREILNQVSSGDIRGFYLKFIADDYVPVISPLITVGESDVEFNVEFKPAADLAVLVNGPSGKPAANTDIALVSSSSHLKLAHGGFSRAGYEIGDDLRHTGANGAFDLPADPEIVRVIAANADGYGEAFPNALATNPVIQMQPWGKLEVTCVAGGEPIAGRKYRVALSAERNGTVKFDSDSATATSDARGRLDFYFLPPGTEMLIRERKNADGSSEWESSSALPIQVHPGETNTVTLDETASTSENNQAKVN